MLNVLVELKGINVEREDLESLVLKSAFVKTIRAEYEHLNLEVPVWIDEAGRLLRREITSRNADAVANRRKSLKAELDSLKTREERRKDLENELAKLETAGV